LVALVILPALITIGAAHSITNIKLTPSSPACLEFREFVEVTFDYSTNDTSGIDIYSQPLTGGSDTPNYAVRHPGNFPVGNGSGNGSFTVTRDEVTVDQLRLQMYSWHDRDRLLHEVIIPVEYHFATECPEATEASILTPIGFIALVSLLSAIAAVAIVGKRR
ncbi:MAG: hypothetical protein ACP5E9_03260, partial [Candidatus Methanospirareceae archaeon]